MSSAVFKNYKNNKFAAIIKSKSVGNINNTKNVKNIKDDIKPSPTTNIMTTWLNSTKVKPPFKVWWYEGEYCFAVEFWFKYTFLDEYNNEKIGRSYEVIRVCAKDVKKAILKATNIFSKTIESDDFKDGFYKDKNPSLIAVSGVFIQLDGKDTDFPVPFDSEKYNFVKPLPYDTIYYSVFDSSKNNDIIRKYQFMVFWDFSHEKEKYNKQGQINDFRFKIVSDYDIQIARSQKEAVDMVKKFIPSSLNYKINKYYKDKELKFELISGIYLSVDPKEYEGVQTVFDEEEATWDIN